jgi:glycosyltransferase involved in cell wall biosynthesis
MVDFSVIISTHNRPRLVVQCVKSVLAQTLPPCEIIVVDDGSRPATGRALAPYREQGHICYIWQRQQGWGAARVLGAQHSRGAILAFLDDDCCAPPDWLARYAAAYERFPDADGIGGGLRPGSRTNVAGRRQYAGHRAYFNRLNAPLGTTADRAGRAWFTFGGNRTFRRAVWLGAQPEQSSSWYHDDTLIDLTLREQGAVIYYEPDAWVTHYYALSVLQRIRMAYRFGRSEQRAQKVVPADLPVVESGRGGSLVARWRQLHTDTPGTPFTALAWYLLTQPLTWIARRAGRWRG